MIIERFYKTLKNTTISMRRKIRKKQNKNIFKKNNYQKNKYIKNYNKKRVIIDDLSFIDIF